MTELHPDHPLVKELRDFARLVATSQWTTPDILELHKVLDAHLPPQSFGDRVLAHLPEGWTVFRCSDGRWSFYGPENKAQLTYIRESADPKAVADALLLLAGEVK